VLYVAHNVLVASSFAQYVGYILPVFCRYIILMNLVIYFPAEYHSDDSYLFFKSCKLFWQIYLRDKMCEKDYHFNVTMVPISCSRYRKKFGIETMLCGWKATDVFNKLDKELQNKNGRLIRAFLWFAASKLFVRPWQVVENQFVINWEPFYNFCRGATAKEIHVNQNSFHKRGKIIFLI